MHKEKPLLSHHLVGMRVALRVLRSLGFQDHACLRGTGINASMLEESSISKTVISGAHNSISIEQEFQFYRNVLEVSGDPLIGLKIGQAYRYEAYGLLGYAMLSAQTLRDTIAIAADFSVLTFSHFTIHLLDTPEAAGVAYTLDFELAPDLIQLYCDRDLQAAFTGVAASGVNVIEGSLVKLMHNDTINRQRYEGFFNCPVEFGHHRNEILIDPAFLDYSSPQHDRRASEYCQAQCKTLLSKFGLESGFVKQVRKKIVARPGTFPSIDETAQQLNMSVRTLRRNLKKEGSSFQALLDEVRQELAQEYLLSSMSIERIAELLGYSEAANFSHAFKRWTGRAPSQYRSTEPKL